MGEILAVVITMGARKLVCGEREREERRRGEKQVSGTETFVKIWYINVRGGRHFFKHRSYERVDTQAGRLNVYIRGERYTGAGRLYRYMCVYISI